MVGVLDTNDRFALGSAAVALKQAEIAYDVVPIADVPDHLKATHPKWWVHPSRILVSAEDEAEARALVERFQSPLERSEVGDALERDGLSCSNVAETRSPVMTLPLLGVLLGVLVGSTLVASAFNYFGVISEARVFEVFIICAVVGICIFAVALFVDTIQM